MNKEKKIKHISSLIFKQRISELSEVESKELNDWLEESDSNKNLFDKLKQGEFLEKSYSRYSSLETSNDWQQIENKLGKSCSLRFLTKKIIGYAAIFTILISSAYLVYKYKPIKDIKVAKESPIIAPGSNKAILTLADGQNIQLDKKALEITNVLEKKHIVLDSNILSYKKGNTLSGAQAEIHKITVPRGGEYQLVLSDGTKVWINSETELKYPKYFNSKERVVYLKGEAYFKVSKNKNKPFKVVTENSITKVLGTEFNVNNYTENEGVKTTLVEGSVMVTNRSTDKSLKLKPSQQSEIAGNNITCKTVDVNKYVLWKEGKFYFDKKPLEYIVTQIERWYDIEVFFMDESIKNYMFTGVINKEYSANKIFEIIGKTTNVRFKIKNKTVTAFKRN